MWMHETPTQDHPVRTGKRKAVGPVQFDDLPFSSEEERAEAVNPAGEKYVYLQVWTSKEENYFWADSEGNNTWGKQL